MTFRAFILLFVFSLMPMEVLRAQDFDPTVSPRNSFLFSRHQAVQDTVHVADYQAQKTDIIAVQDVLPEAKIFGSEPDLPVSKPEAPLSPVELYYSERIGEPIKQFGYDVFQGHDLSEIKSIKRPYAGVSDAYVLGPGDRLAISFVGERNERALYNVGSNGQVFIKDLPPINAAGLSMQRFTEALNALVRQSYHSTSAYVSLDEVKEMPILVIGEVESPGRHLLPGQASLMDVLYAVGGIKKSGSLRTIKRIRLGQTVVFDLYDVLLYGLNEHDLDIRAGDRIIVPPLGPSLAVSGHVHRPAIYELSTELLEDPALNIEAALALSGGALSRIQNRFTLFALQPNGKDRLIQVNQSSGRLLKENDIIDVRRALTSQSSAIELVGAVRNPGTHALQKGEGVQDWLGDVLLYRKDAYMLLGLIERTEEGHFARRIIPFSPLKVIEGLETFPLKENDRVIVLSQSDLVSFQGGHALNGISSDVDKMLKDLSVPVRGAVLRPGIYPLMPGTSVGDIVQAAGGLSVQADPSRIELNALIRKKTKDGFVPSGRSKRQWLNAQKQDLKKVVVSPKDAVRVHALFRDTYDVKDTVRISGEVLYPGDYDLARGDTLLDLIHRAGGVTEEAYPEGAVFSRMSERMRQEDVFKAQALEIEKSIAAALEKDDLDKDEIGFLKRTVENLREAKSPGRIIVEADPAVLKSHESQDILLETGDRIFIPKRSITVRVAGEVMSPAVLPFKKKKSVREYIEEAGGYGRNADKSYAFVVFPDGKAQPLKAGFWQTPSDVKIVPGSTIIVPRDPEPFRFLETTRDFSQILTNIAITGIFIDDIADDD